MPIRRTTSVSRNVRPALELSPDLSEEACDAVVFLAGDPVRLTRTKLVKGAHGAPFRWWTEAHHAGQDFPARAEDLEGGRPIAA